MNNKGRYNVLGRMLEGFIERQGGLLGHIANVSEPTDAKFGESQLNIQTDSMNFSVLFSQEDFEHTTLVQFDNFVIERLIGTTHKLSTTITFDDVILENLIYELETVREVV